MPITLPLQKMSVEEKIQMMESIWSDLCENAQSTLTPDWHEGVLVARNAALLSGQDEIMDWETAKQRIAEELQ